MKKKYREEYKEERLSIESTMGGPLWARATYSPTNPDILKDSQASEIIKKIDVDFSVAQEFCGEYLGINFIVRARKFDDAIKRFIKEFPNATVVNIGCGLDTTFSRIDNGTIKWYDLDLPSAIEYRLKLIPETKRSFCISKSMFDYSWFDDIEYDKKNGIFFFAAGVFNYFEENEISKLCIEIANRFPGGELMFDVPSKLGLMILNRRIKKMGLDGMEMHFGLGSPVRQISKWSDKIKVIEWYTLFDRIPRNLNWEKNTIRLMNLSDKFKIGKYVLLRFLN
ncbi:MAG: class I SAM-dependent methyltransferase [Promethearchaeota archaeon]